MSVNHRSSATGFFAVITGQVDSGEVDGVDHLAIHYSFSYGADWSRVHGVETGVSQIAIRTPGEDSRFVWNYPIEATFHSTNVHGWPQLVVSAYGINWQGKDLIKGYGCTFLPTTPGRHTRYVRLYAPFSSSRFQECCAWLTSSPAEFFEPHFIAQGRGREVARVRSSGVIKVTINLATKNMTEWGYRISGTQERSDTTLAQPPEQRRTGSRTSVPQSSGAPATRSDNKHDSASRRQSSTGATDAPAKRVRPKLRTKTDPPRARRNSQDASAALGLMAKEEGGRGTSKSRSRSRKGSQGPSAADEARALLAQHG